MKGFKVFNISWCVESDDIIDVPQNEVENEIEKIKKSLPNEVFIPFVSDDSDEISEKSEEIADILSDNYGWLVNSFDVDIC